MTFEEMNRTMEFVVQQSARFSIHMEELFRGLNELKEQTARFETWASEVVAIQSRRIDQHDQRIKQNEQSLKEQERLRRDIMRLLNLILDRLPRSNN